MKTRKIKKTEHPLYDNEAEFNKYNPKTEIVPNWRNGEEDDWILTDDGQVCQILKRGAAKQKYKTHYYVRTVIGTFLCRPDTEMKGEMRQNIYTFSPSGSYAYEQIKTRKSPTRREFLFAKYVAKGDDIVEAFKRAYPSDNSGYAERQSRLLLSTERVKSLIREEIDKVLNEAEITPLYILERMKDIIENPGARDSDKVSILKELVTVAGMKDTEKRSESITVFQGFTKEQLNAIEGKDVKKIAEAKREIEK